MQDAVVWTDFPLMHYLEQKWRMHTKLTLNLKQITVTHKQKMGCLKSGPKLAVRCSVCSKHAVGWRGSPNVQSHVRLRLFDFGLKISRNQSAYPKLHVQIGLAAQRIA
jgi:hypothetical protein